MANQKTVEELILECLEKQDFADFYDGEDSDFVRYIQCDDDAMSKDAMLANIRRLFRRVIENANYS